MKTNKRHFVSHDRHERLSEIRRETIQSLSSFVCTKPNSCQSDKPRTIIVNGDDMRNGMSKLQRIHSRERSPAWFISANFNSSNEQKQRSLFEHRNYLIRQLLSLPKYHFISLCLRQSPYAFTVLHCHGLHLFCWCLFRCMLPPMNNEREISWNKLISWIRIERFW